MDARIVKVEARTVFDSRGVETIEVDIFTPMGAGRSAAPFGAPGSRGEFEAPAYGEKGLTNALIVLREEIIPGLMGMDASNLEEVDRFLINVDGSFNFQRIGGNTASTVSTACLKAAARSSGIPLYRFLQGPESGTLPYPLGNMIGGGAHSMGPAPDMQEHLVVPRGAKSIREAVAVNIKVHEEVGKILERGSYWFTGGSDDENAWTGNLNDEESLDVLTEACDRISFVEGMELRQGLDLAADRLWDPSAGVYRYSREGRVRDPREQLDYLSYLIEKYNLIYVEDGFHSNDYDSFSRLNQLYGSRCFICADDIYASHPQRTFTGIEKKSANAMIIKPNQVGTLSETQKTARLAADHGIQIILSHRSGETLDDSISHLAVAWKALMIKTGVKGGERLAKLNELIRIEDWEKTMKMADWP